MSEWKEYKLDDIVEIIKEPYFPTGSDDLKYIGLEHIEPETLRLISIGNSNEVSSNKYKFKANDVLFGKLRPYFRKVVKPDFNGICSTDIWVFRAKKGFDQNFMFYFLANWDFVNLANSGESGTRMPRADWGFLKETIWKLPPLNKQIEIAEILSSLDDKIDLLNRQNKILERLAETLFRQRFVEEAEDDWNTVKLGTVITVKGGTTPSTARAEYWNGSIHWTSPSDLSNNSSIFLFDTSKKITERGLKQIGSGLLPIGSVLLSSRAPIGYLVITNIPVSINQGYIGIICDKLVSNYFMFLWIKKNLNMLINSANGSVFLEISKSTFKGLNFKIPPNDMLKQFDKMIIPYFHKIKSNSCQMRILFHIRDIFITKFLKKELTIKNNGIL